MNEIICGDCIEIMKTIPKGFVNLIMTSPPYNVGLNYEGYDDNLSDEEYLAFTGNWLKGCFRVAAESTRLYVVLPDKHLWWFREVAENIGWVYVQNLVWCKPNLNSTFGKVKNDWNYLTETILLFRKGKRTPMLFSDYARTFNWFVETSPQTNFKEGRIHPAQLPTGLCVQIIARTPGEVVFDPFCGSGQVLRAARVLGRSYLGIELIPSVVEKAKVYMMKDVDLEKIAAKEKKWK